MTDPLPLMPVPEPGANPVADRFQTHYATPVIGFVEITADDGSVSRQLLQLFMPCDHSTHKAEWRAVPLFV